jgi:RNA polymerase sigma-70 factor (ECF subfamily)
MPALALNRAVAVGERDGPAAMLETLGTLPGLPLSHLWHAARADALQRLGRLEEARHELLTAVDLAPTGPERRLLARRLTDLLPGPGHSH